MSESFGSKTVKGTIWAAIDRFGVMALQFFVNLILARLLVPEDFGAIGLLYIFIAISLTFIDGGFGSALIQKKIPTETDYSTIFFWNILTGFFFYILLFFSAPLIADYYKLPILKNILRIIGITLVLNGILAVQTNRLQKSLKFNIIAITNIASYILSAVLTVILAFYGYGVWSLVCMSICQPTCRIILLFIITRWIPLLVFSKASLKQLVSFGGYLLLGNLLESIFKNIQGLIIGRKFSASQMGYYTQADKLDQIVSYSIPQVIASVMYPVFSKFQDDKDRLMELMKIDLRVISFLIYPLLTIMIIMAEPIILFLYGEKWLTSALYFRILCFGGFFYSLNNIPYYAVAACGKSRSLFFVSIYKWGALAILLFIGMNLGMVGIMWAISISYLNIFIINCILAKKYIQIKICQIIVSLFPSVIVCTICAVCINACMMINNKTWIIWIFLFIFIYLLLVRFLNKKAYKDALLILKKIKKQ